jgi:hypothetical protein
MVKVASATSKHFIKIISIIVKEIDRYTYIYIHTESAINKYTLGNEFFVEDRKNTGDNEHFEWFVDKEGRLTNAWANKVMFPLSLSRDTSIWKRSFITLVTDFKDNDNVGYQGHVGSYTSNFFPRGFHFNKTNSN